MGPFEMVLSLRERKVVVVDNQRPSDLAQTKGGQCKSSKVPENLLKRQNSARGR